MHRRSIKRCREIYEKKIAIIVMQKILSNIGASAKSATPRRTKYKNENPSEVGSTLYGK